MKRFYCHRCQKVQRVRQLPDTSNENGQLVGVCDWHSSKTRAAHKRRGVKPRVRIVTEAEKPSAKRKGR